MPAHCFLQRGGFLGLRAIGLVGCRASFLVNFDYHGRWLLRLSAAGGIRACSGGRARGATARAPARWRLCQPWAAARGFSSQLRAARRWVEDCVPL